MNRHLKRILLSILIFLGLDLLAGLILIPDDFNSFRTRHHYYHHGLLPNQETMAAWGALIYPLHTNSLGLIDSAAYKLKKQTGNHRILILGDSHSEGVGVPYPKTFAGRLAGRLKSHGMEVINGSAVSYSQKIEFLKAEYLIERNGLEVDEIIVMVDISDLQNELVYEEYEPVAGSGPVEFLHTLKRRLKRASLIYYLADAVRTQRERERFFRSIDNFYEGVRENANNNIWDLYSGFFSHFDNEVLLSNPQFHGMGGWMEDETFRKLAERGIGLGQQYMLRLKELCDAHDIRLTLSVHPWHHQIEQGVTEDDYVQYWETFARRNGIAFINFFPVFIRNGEPAETVITKYYITNDNHWNEFGHLKVADHLEQYFLGETAGSTIPQQPQ